jgi:hypothetical protein
MGIERRKGRRGRGNWNREKEGKKSEREWEER